MTLRNHSPLSVLTCALPLIGLGTAAGCSSDEPAVETRALDHQQLMDGAKLLAPDDSNGIKVLFVQGDSYQMGYQQGALLREELHYFRQALEDNGIWSALLRLAETMGPDGPDGTRTYFEAVRANSLQIVVDECEGIVAGSNQAFTVDECVTLNGVTWLLEDLLPRHLPGAESFFCSEVLAAGPMSADGKLIHGRNLDWLAVEGFVDQPLVMVKSPRGHQRYVTMGAPGWVSTFTGMNESGLTVAVNENSCVEEHRDLTGVPTLQLATKVLMEARNLEQARAIIERAEHATCEIMVIGHGPSRSGMVVERTATSVTFRQMGDDGLLIATNHFLSEEQVDRQIYPDIHNLERASVSRYTRLQERLTGVSLPPHPGLAADAPDFVGGRVDVEVTIDLLRDPMDLRPASNRFSYPCGSQGKWAVGNNSAMQAIVMAPEQRRFWFAGGWDEECRNPAYSPFVGFDVDELFAGSYTPLAVPSYDPPFNGSYGNGVYGPQ